MVIGTCFVDVKCFPYARLDYKGRNPGRVVFQHGGVGRNVAETLARLGAPVRFVSSVTAGGLGDEVTARLAALGVDVRALTQQPADGHGIWVAILEADGDLACSVSQLFDFEGIKAGWRQYGQQILDGAALVVLEVDLDPEAASLVLGDAAAAGVPVIGLPSNLTVVREHPDLLARIHTFICNQHEAGLLTGRPVESADAAAAATALVERYRLQRAVVTLGPAGATAAGAGGPAHTEAIPVTAVDTTGAGDAFVAGFAAATAAGLPTADALACAVRVAGWTVNAAEPVCPNLRDRMAADPWPGWRQVSRI